MRKMYLAQNDAVSRTLTSAGHYDGFRSAVKPSAAADDIAESIERCYGKPVRTPSRDGWVPSHYFAEDN